MFPYLIAGVIGYGIAKLFEEDESPKYDDGGSVLLAPNGKPSKLTPEQYKLVRLPEFKAWFGDWEKDPENASKVVDENGEPLPVYHGTNNDFNVFDVEETRFNYLYFAVNKEYAEKFGKVKSYFINANKIKDVTRVGIKNITTDNAYRVLGWEIEPAYTYGKQKFWIHLKESDEIYRTFKYNNYGAIKFIEDYTDDGSYIETEAFAIINPSIIKLADGTNTTFDGINPDIRYAGGGKVLGYDDVIKKQQIDNPYSDVIFSNENAKFVEETISIEKLRQLNGFSEDYDEIEQSVSYFNVNGMDEDYYVSKKLMNKIVDGVKLSPIVVDENYKVLDGSHRLSAYSELYYYYSYDYPFDGILKIYKRISN